MTVMLERMIQLYRMESGMRKGRMMDCLLE